MSHCYFGCEFFEERYCDGERFIGECEKGEFDEWFDVLISNFVVHR